ncbi:MAG: WbqC family protein [Bacteroidales bacterium]|nr:WbqC family protein [Bacteroidales bacterium]
MSVALFSTAYFPPLAYLSAMMRYREVQIEVKETFPKQTYRNRMLIMTAEGVRTLSVPVVRNNHSRTEEVRIDYKERWNVVHFRTLKAAYAASPYWLHYQEDIEQLLMERRERLVDLNGAVLAWLLRSLKIDCRVSSTEDFHPIAGEATDYRYLFSPKEPSPEHTFPPYYQVFADRQPFAANLSALDLLMNLGPESKDYLETI